MPGAISGSTSADFWAVAHAQVAAFLAKSNTVTVSQTRSWKNTSKTTKWVQLGARGYAFNYVTESNQGTGIVMDMVHSPSSVLTHMVPLHESTRKRKDSGVGISSLSNDSPRRIAFAARI